MSTSTIQTLLEKMPEILLTLPVFGTFDATKHIFAFVLFVLLTAFFWLVRKVLIVRLQSLSTKTKTDVDDVFISALEGVRSWVYTIASLYIVLQIFEFPPTVWKVFTAVCFFALVWQAIEIALRFVEYGAGRFLEKDADGDGEVDPGSATASHMVTLIARLALWTLGGLFILSNLGIEVTSLIAGLGIGGIAVAFALQGILSDLFASFSLYFDKPFRIGDYIVIGEDMGTVEKIGIKTTRIRTLQGEELVVSNAELTSTRVKNFKKMERRRISSQFGVTYETSHMRVKEIPDVVRRIFEAIDKATLDRVHFASFADSALVFEFIYYVESANYTEYMDIQQKFNFELMDKFAELGIDFAYPTQTLYVKKVGGE